MHEWFVFDFRSTIPFSLHWIANTHKPTANIWFICLCAIRCIKIKTKCVVACVCMVTVDLSSLKTKISSFDSLESAVMRMSSLWQCFAAIICYYCCCCCWMTNVCDCRSDFEHRIQSSYRCAVRTQTKRHLCRFTIIIIKQLNKNRRNLLCLNLKSSSIGLWLGLLLHSH